MNHLDHAAALLSHLAPDEVGPAKADLQSRLRSLPIPETLQNFFCNRWFRTPTGIATVDFFDPVGILHHDHLEEALSMDLIPIGSGDNGDPILLP